MTKVNKPKIRFKNFNDSWSLRKLSDTQTDFKDGNYGVAYPKETDLTSSTQGVPFLRGSDLDNGKLTLTNARYITQSKHNELISGHLIEDDIVIAVRGSLGSLGYVGPDNEGWNINSQLAIIRTRKIELIGNYLIQFLLSNRGNKEISSHITGTALKQLPIKQLKNIKVPIPKIEEQSAIGSLFRTLDDLLASYKDNLANYQSLRATMLSKMFPKAGQTVPEIRLDGFDGEWEVQTLKELASFSKGNGYTKNDLVNSGKEIILYGRLYTNYQTVISKVNTFVTTVKANTVISKGGEVVVPASGESAEDISRASVVEKSGVILGGDLNIIYPDENKVDSIFLALTISNGSQQKELIKRAQGKSVVHLRNNDLEKVVLHYPSTEEQRAIGSYFTNLDNLINSHQEKISQLETLKKKLLQDMFI